jgi:hypothetical protein
VNSNTEHDETWFRSHVLPGLAEVTLVAIAEVTGMSTSAASKVRAGRRVPHPRPWQPVATLLKVSK